MTPLQGLKVVDFTTLLPGPLTSLLLAEAGAEVIKIERPGNGDELRHYPPDFDGTSALFAMLNRGKQSITLDLKAEKDRANLFDLIDQSDILLEQFRPGVMTRVGLDYETLQRRAPGLIYCSITGYGQSGPKAQVAGHDLNYVADTGMLALAAGAGGEPVVPAGLVADIAGGGYPAVMNILMALIARQRSGLGCHLDIAMTDNLFPFLFWALGQGQVTGQWPRPGQELFTGGSPRYRIYPTKDGRHLAVASLEERFWQRFCALIGLPEDRRDDSLDPEATTAAVSERLAERNADDWLSLFQGEDICCNLVRSLEEALADPHYREGGLFDKTVTSPRGRDMSALPLPLADHFRDDALARTAPMLGES